MDTIVTTPAPTVTTGPLPASRKVYATPDAAPDLRVPLREIELSSPLEPPVRVYDTTGPYTDADITIDVRRGLRLLAAWDEVWLKLDAGTQNYLSKVNRPDITLEQVLKNILTLGRKRPIVIQSLFPDDPAARLTQDESEQ